MRAKIKKKDTKNGLIRKLYFLNYSVDQIYDYLKETGKFFTSKSYIKSHINTLKDGSND